MQEKLELYCNWKTEYYAMRNLIFATVFWMPMCFVFIFCIPDFFCFAGMFVSYMLLFFIPAIIIHSNYEKYSKHKRLIVDASSLNVDGWAIEFSSIKEINARGTGSALGLYYFTGVIDMSGYYYLEIMTDNDEKIILTSLLSKDLLKIIRDRLPSIEINLQHSIYPIVRD